MSYRIQFDISEEEFKELEPFILNVKHRHVFAHKALSEWVARQLGNQKRRKGGIDGSK